MPQRHFFDQVYLITLQIPRGKVINYGRIAEMLSAPGAARTVGWALHALTPEQSDLIPWQRVINKSGRCSIRHAEHDINEQQALLEAEGVLFDECGYTDMRVFGWEGMDPDEIHSLLECALLPWETEVG